MWKAVLAVVVFAIPHVAHAACGDGVVDPGEQCDDGNHATGDGCDAECYVEAGWTCGANGCNTVCGDGVVAGAEECDDDNTAGGDGCSGGCTIEHGWTCWGNHCIATCGDGIIVGTEQCDDGNAHDGDGCDTSCMVEYGWTCADATAVTGIAGSACRTECGDGRVAGAETCDDGNTQSGDGCSATCQLETGFSCVGEHCASVCGDGIVAGKEQCDDANSVAGDGCTNCVLDPGYSCSGTVCVKRACGDGMLELGVEQCDDGNYTGGDGCSASCTIEPGYVCDLASPSHCETSPTTAATAPTEGAIPAETVSGCNAAGSSSGLLMLGVVGLLRRKRRR